MEGLQMVKDMTGKTCVVSGAAGGIGFDVCRKFAEQGAEAELRIQETEYESELYADQESTSHFHVDEAKLLNAINYLMNK